MNASQRPTMRDGLELTAAVATAVIHILPLERLYPEVIEISVIVAGWAGYVVLLLSRDRDRLKEMGFRREGLAGCTAASFVVFAAALLAMAFWGFHAGTLRFAPSMLVLALLYPLWGLVQQGLLQGIVTRQLTARIPVWSAVAVTALIFGALHLPYGTLAVGTFALGLVLTPIYLRWRNLWPLGIVHGWLAIPMYFWVLGVDPWANVTG